MGVVAEGIVGSPPPPEMPARKHEGTENEKEKDERKGIESNN
jgi:hypothetical protein